MFRFLMTATIVILLVSSVNILVFASNCEGPFGDKDTAEAHEGNLLGYVEDVKFHKNVDGSWQVKSCELETVSHSIGKWHVNISFRKPYPSHENLKKGDWVCITTGSYDFSELGNIAEYYDCILYENLTDSADECTVKPPNGIMNANVEIDAKTASVEELGKAIKMGNEVVELQCVVVAVQYIENPDISPDYDYDLVVDGIVVKCGDGKLSGVGFFSRWLETRDEKEVIQMPGIGVLREGDKITIRVDKKVQIFGPDPIQDRYHAGEEFVCEGWK